MQATQAPADEFGMHGLLNIMNGVNPALSSFAKGIDLTTLGLNMTSSESIYKKFASPWSNEPATGEPEYNIPECYYAKQPPALKVSIPTWYVRLLEELLCAICTDLIIYDLMQQNCFSTFLPETLFYIFYR